MKANSYIKELLTVQSGRELAHKTNFLNRYYDILSGELDFNKFQSIFSGWEVFDMSKESYFNLCIEKIKCKNYTKIFTINDGLGLCLVVMFMDKNIPRGVGKECVLNKISSITINEFIVVCENNCIELEFTEEFAEKIKGL